MHVAQRVATKLYAHGAPSRTRALLRDPSSAGRRSACPPIQRRARLFRSGNEAASGIIDTLSAEIKGRVKTTIHRAARARVGPQNRSAIQRRRARGLLYIRVNDTHPNFRVVAARLSTPQLREAWRKPQPRPRMAMGVRHAGERESRVCAKAEPVSIVDPDARREAFRAAVRPLVERPDAELGQAIPRCCDGPAPLWQRSARSCVSLSRPGRSGYWNICPAWLFPSDEHAKRHPARAKTTQHSKKRCHQRLAYLCRRYGSGTGLWRRRGEHSEDLSAGKKRGALTVGRA